MQAHASLRHLQKHTTLKHDWDLVRGSQRLRYLQNHTTLKQRLCFIFFAFGLRHL